MTTPSDMPKSHASKSHDVLQDLQARGLIYQHTPGLEEHFAQPRTIYCGCDPTADSLHVGHLLPFMTLRRLQLAGHRVLPLVGGATGMVGDPSFKATERKLLDEETLAHNVRGIAAQVALLLQDVPESSLGPSMVVNNYDWTKGVTALEFLRDIGKHFTVNQMIARDSVKSRLERDGEGLSFTEFAYALLQGFDFLHLFQHQNCSVQLGGSDQWGNMTAGTELIRKKLGAKGEAHVMTLPLITKADGTKFGKSEGGAIWLDARRTSPYAFYQFWLNTADADVARMLMFFSMRPVADIEAMMANHSVNPAAREPQKALARELTQLLHGADALAAAERITGALFGGDINDLTADDFAQLALDGLPTTRSETPLPLLDALVNSGLASSKREARDFLQQGAIQHNGEAVAGEDLSLTQSNGLFGAYHLLKRGKKQFALTVTGA